MFDLSQLDDETFKAIEAAWHAYAVLIFPGQHLSDETHIAFTKRFGRLESGITLTKKAGPSPILEHHRRRYHRAAVELAG